jgi:hypothetical protein
MISDVENWNAVVRKYSGVFGTKVASHMTVGSTATVLVNYSCGQTNTTILVTEFCTLPQTSRLVKMYYRP